MQNKSIIAIFKENEYNVSVLYALYAQKVPGKQDFWNKLSNEEIAHAAKISDKECVSCDIIENKFARGVASYIMNFVLAETERAKKEKITHRDALRSALRIERSMLEKKCFDMFTPAKKTVKEIFTRLNSDTERHVQILLKEAKKNKFTLADRND